MRSCDRLVSLDVMQLSPIYIFVIYCLFMSKMLEIQFNVEQRHIPLCLIIICKLPSVIPLCFPSVVISLNNILQ